MKRLLYIFVLTIVVLGCTKDPVESKLKELDKMLSNRAVYAQKLEHRADSIRLEMMIPLDGNMLILSSTCIGFSRSIHP